MHRRLVFEIASVVVRKWELLTNVYGVLLACHCLMVCVYLVAQFVDFWFISFVCVSNHWISISNKRSRVARLWLLRDIILVIYHACTYTTLERELFAYEIVTLLSVLYFCSTVKLLKYNLPVCRTFRKPCHRTKGRFLERMIVKFHMILSRALTTLK